MAGNVKRWTLEIDADGRRAMEEVDDVERKFNNMDLNKGFKAKLAKMSGIFKKQLGSLVGAGKPLAITAGTAFSLNFIGAVVSGLASGAGKIAHGVAAIGALLPAAALGGVLAFGALRVAVIGVGDAIKAGLTGDTEAWNEAMKGLSQSGQEFARAIASLRPELDQLKKSVQENFFEQFDERVRRLALTYLPILEENLKLTARGFGQAAAESMKILQSRPVVEALKGALENARTAIGNLTAGVPNLVAAFVPLVSVGSTFLPGLTGGFETVTGRIRDFMLEAERTGRLRDFIQGGIDKLWELWETTKQIGRIFENLAGIANKVFPGINGQSSGLLDAIERVTGRFNEFLETARGSETARTIFNTMSDLIGSFFGTLQVLGQVLADAFGPVLPDLAAFLDALAQLKTELIQSLQPALELLADLIGKALRGLTDLFNWISENEGALATLRGVVIGLFTAWAVHAAIAAAATLLPLLPFILIGAAVGLLAYLMVKHWDTIKGAIEEVFNWVKDNWPVLIAILTGPLAPLILLFITHFDTIKSIFMEFVDLVLALWDRFGSTILDYVRRVWENVWMILQGAFDIIVGIWNIFAGIFTGDWSRVWDGIKMIFEGIWQVIQGIFGLALAQIQYVMGLAWNAIEAAVGIAWDLITGVISGAWDWIKTTVSDAIDWVADKIETVMGTISDIWDSIWGGMGDALSGIWDTIRGAVVRGINLVILAINWFIRLINRIPGVPDIPELQPIPGGGGGGNPRGRQRTGSQEHQAQRRARGGFLTNGPQFLVGEGNPAHREAVIATDPRFRRRNIGLWAWAGQQLGVLPGRTGLPGGRGQRREGKQAFLPGGIPNPIDVVEDAVGGAINVASDAASAATRFIREMSVAALGPVRDQVKRMVNAVPGGGLIDTLKGGVNWAIDKIYDWAKGKTEEHERNVSILSTAAGNNAGFHGIGGVERWRGTALEALRLAGAPASWIGSLLRRMMQESGGNPRATNNWDINARRGDPSKGLMQTIGATFNAYAGHLRHRGIYDPLANIYAAIRYTIARYGSGPAGWDRAGGYRGGLRRVPRDNFPMRAHEGERLLNRREALEYERRPRGGDGPAILIQGNLVIHANSYEEGREAMRGAHDYLDTLEERRVTTDARIA